MTVERVKLAKVVDVKGGKRLPAGASLSSEPTAHPYIRGQDIRGGRIRASEQLYITEAVFEKIRRYTVKAGDVCVTIVGNIGDVGFTPLELDGANLTENAVKLIPTTSKLDSRFLAYALLSPEAQQQMKLSAAGAAQPKLGIYKVNDIEIPLPSIDRQRRIASILSAYDDLIENNTRRIAILKEMARRIYEEWFVRFRFPGHEDVRMVGSELGLVPEGWPVQSLYDVADLTYGFPFKSNLFKENGEGLGVIRIRDIRDDYTATRTTEDADLKYRVADGDILVGMDGAFHMGRWAGGVAWLNQRVVRFRPKAGIPRSWLFWVTMEPIKTLESTIVGTTVAHLSARDLKEMRVLVPSKAALEAAAFVLEPMSDLELTLKKKNAVLRVTRDLLLTKLISGELEVSAMPEPEAVAA